MEPYEASHRFTIISDAHTMNPESSNALLKILEEPPDRTILILTTSRRSDLLPTIVSRCQEVHFSPIPQQNLEDILAAEKGISSTEAAIVAAMSGGSFTRAMHMRQSDWMARRNRVLTILGSKPSQSIWSMPVNRLMALAESLSKNREQLTEALAILKSWIRDLAVSRYAPRLIINKDHTEAVLEAARNTGLQQLLSFMAAILEAERKMEANLNLRLLTESLVMRLVGQTPVYR